MNREFNSECLSWDLQEPIKQSHKLTLCFVAISLPCSLVIFRKCIRSTLFATKIIGKDSLEKIKTTTQLLAGYNKKC